MPTPIPRTFTQLVKGISLVAILTVATVFVLRGKAEGLLYVSDANGTVTSTSDMLYNSSTRMTTLYGLSVGAGGFSLGGAQIFGDITSTGTAILNNVTFNTMTGGAATTTNFDSTYLLSNNRFACLEDGTHCPAFPPPTELDTLFTVTNRGSVATATLTLYGGINVSTITATGTSAFQALSFTNATGSNTTSTNLFATNLALLPTNTLIGGTTVCLSNGTNCPSSYAALSVTTLTVRNILDINGAPSSTLVLSGRSAEIGATPPIPTSTALSLNGFPRTVPAMNATSTNCVYWGPEYIRDAWNGSAMKPTIEWTSATGSGAIIWSLQAQSMASGTYMGTAFSGAKSYATSTVRSGFFTYDSAMTDLTLGSAATGTAVKFALCREGAHAQDTFGGDAYPNSLKIKYGLSSYSD